jgi:hypothetical protein
MRSPILPQLAIDHTVLHVNRALRGPVRGGQIFMDRHLAVA